MIYRRAIEFVLLCLAISSCGINPSLQNPNDPNSTARSAKGACTGYNAQGTATIQNITRNVNTSTGTVASGVVVHIYFTPSDNSHPPSTFTMTMTAQCAHDEGFARGRTVSATAWIKEGGSCDGSSLVLDEASCI